MLFEIAFVIMLILTPLLAFLGFLKGVEIGARLAQGERIEPKSLVFGKKEEPVTPESERERLQRIINQNIENYGTDIPQMDVV